MADESARAAGDRLDFGLCFFGFGVADCDEQVGSYGSLIRFDQVGLGLTRLDQVERT